MDVVATQLKHALQKLAACGINYSVEYTQPYSRTFEVNNSSWYVVRQRQKSDGSVCLLAAAKMGKEVF